MDRRFAFYELAKHFLQSYNPRCYKEVVILNCILNYEGIFPEVGDRPMRYFAHDFVGNAVAMIEHNIPAPKHHDEITSWIDAWMKENT